MLLRRSSQSKSARQRSALSYVIEALGDVHDRAGFTCGRNDVLDSFCQTDALRDHSENFVRVRVAVHEGQPRVLGYHALMADSVKGDIFGYLLGRGRDDKKLPVIHLTMVAACKNHHGSGVGPALMKDVFETVASVADHIGACCLYLEAACEGLIPYYEDWGFKRVSSKRLAMYMPIATVRDALTPADNDDFLASKPVEVA